MALLQSRYFSLQSPNVGDRDLCSHPDAKHIGNCATLADIDRPGWGCGDAVAFASENSSVGRHRGCGDCSQALSWMSLFPCLHEHSGVVADFRFRFLAKVRDNLSPLGSWRPRANRANHSRTTRAERFSANFRDRLATVRARSEDPLKGASDFFSAALLAFPQHLTTH